MNQDSSSFRRKMAFVSILSLFLMAYIDYVTGYELVFSAAYLIPVSMCAWYFGRRSVLLMSIASGLATWLMDEWSGHPYSNFLFQYGNSFTCFLISIVTGLILHRLKRTLQERQQVNRDLKQALEDLERSTEQVRKLQNGLQVVCAWTKQIRVGDKWLTPDEFLSSQLNLKITHGMSPEAAREFEQELATRARLDAESLAGKNADQGKN